MSVVAAVAQAISDRTNPVVVKELRQAVQSRLVIAILLLFLLANTLVVSGYLTMSLDVLGNPRAGQNLFSMLFVMLTMTSMIFVPLYAAVRLTVERNDSNIDLLFITTIAPSAIIRGKFWSAIALMALIYSTCLPFLTLTYLLRGIDLPSIFFALGVAFATTAVLTMFAIFVGSIAGGWLIRLIMAGALFFVGGFTLLYTIIGGMAIVQTGLASTFSGRNAWAGLSVCILLGLTIWGLLYLLAVAAVSPRASNRMFPLRVFMTLAWLVFGVILGIWSQVERIEDPVQVWLVTSIALSSGCLPFLLAERESWTPRVRRRIPSDFPRRALAWLLYSGSAGGILWCALLAVTTLVAGFAVLPKFDIFGTARTLDMDFHFMIGALLFSWCYTMTGLLLRRMIVPRSAPLIGTAISLLLFALGCTLPILLAFAIRGPNWRFGALPLSVELTHPFVLDRTGADRVVVYWFLGIWAFLGFAVNMPWFVLQWRAFRRYDVKPIARSESATAESAVLHA